MNYIQRAKKFRTKKRLGQNFLVDENIIEKIITEANFSPNDTALEIGPGIGFVTEKAAQKVSKIIAVEIDKEAINELIELNLPNLEIFEQDILKTDISALSKEPVKVIANIPYYITTPILVHLLGEIDQQSYKNRQSVKEIILMVQYEVALRLVANEKSPSKDYGLISILTNYWSMPEFICKVPASAFYPAPKVDSALIKLTVREKPAVEINNPALFRQVIQASFGMRRENIKNALTKGGFSMEVISKALEETSIDSNRRGETLSIDEFKTLSENIEKLSLL